MTQTEDPVPTPARSPKIILAALLLGAAATSALVGAGAARGRPAAAAPARADLADTAQGSYFGDVISDARGSSRSEVRITVTKIGPNRVRIASDYARLPAFEATLTRAMDTVQNADGDEVFLLDLAQSPHSLHVTVDDASWAGARE
ncbi:MAG TPA: hypothetical protein VN231_13880 [Allosphingosinicella sp.]|nr:hypothetical protein [Allosphingosinicella sp.]